MQSSTAHQIPCTQFCQVLSTPWELTLKEAKHQPERGLKCSSHLKHVVSVTGTKCRLYRLRIQHSEATAAGIALKVSFFCYLLHSDKHTEIMSVY